MARKKPEITPMQQAVRDLYQNGAHAMPDDQYAKFLLDTATKYNVEIGTLEGFFFDYVEQSAND